MARRRLPKNFDPSVVNFQEDLESYVVVRPDGHIVFPTTVDDIGRLSSTGHVALGRTRRTPVRLIFDFNPPKSVTRLKVTRVSDKSARIAGKRALSRIELDPTEFAGSYEPHEVVVGDKPMLAIVLPRVS